MTKKKIGINIYNKIPSKIKNILGKQKWLKPIRDKMFRRKEVYKEVETFIKKEYINYSVEFKFIASFQVSAKATKRGIESKLLNNSIKLVNKYKTHNNDLYVLDVGANFGFLSLVWANTLAKNGKTMAFEPNINLFHTFSKSIVLNELQNRLSVFNKAIGNDNKVLELYMENTTSNILELNNSNTIQEIEMITLDTFSNSSNMEKCDLLKIDVDGIELDILKGGAKLIEKFKPIVIIETNEDIRIVEFMKMLDYTIFDMDLNVLKETDVLPLNIFCVSK
ncbi:hypothetical protein DI383_02275 [Flavobacteriaceae bacterium LYZ1037]|nr:hypothetical protein DI383_02275 [Flavobacteriaceae bacterium LYZ1037]